MPVCGVSGEEFCELVKWNSRLISTGLKKKNYLDRLVTRDIWIRQCHLLYIPTKSENKKFLILLYSFYSLFLLFAVFADSLLK